MQLHTTTSLHTGHLMPLGADTQSPAELRRNIIYAITIVFEVEARALRAPTRSTAEVAFARQVAMYLAHVAYGLSLSETGRIFTRDRTTVAHACRLVEDRRDDTRIDRTLELLEAVVGRLKHVTAGRFVSPEIRSAPVCLRL
jgi:chromosomal replication initiation ATPase DnaA